MKQRPFACWRIYAGPNPGSGLWVYARVFPTKESMHATLRREARRAGTKNGVASQVLGLMETYQVLPAHGHSTGCIGRVNLFQSRMGTEIVVHEFTHAMFAWAERKRLLRSRRDMPLEEQMCYALGRMTSRFVARARRAGFYAD